MQLRLRSQRDLLTFQLLIQSTFIQSVVSSHVISITRTTLNLDLRIRPVFRVKLKLKLELVTITMGRTRDVDVQETLEMPHYLASSNVDVT